MFCPHCGTPSVAGSGYCSACGKPLSGASAVGTSGAAPRSVDAPTTAGPLPHAPAITQLPDASSVETVETAAIRQMMGDRYQIIRLLGVGGMGAVYQAWDAELGVAVAIKVIRPEVMADPSAAAEVERRFKRELLLARQVTHKNVVRIHDIGEMLGIKYITMPYVDGADLATISKNEGRLPVPRILRIARGIPASCPSNAKESHPPGGGHATPSLDQGETRR